MGGTGRQDEIKKLAKDVNIVVATPGRLLDHLQVRVVCEIDQFWNDLFLDIEHKRFHV